MITLEEIATEWLEGLISEDEAVRLVGENYTLIFGNPRFWLYRMADHLTS